MSEPKDPAIKLFGKTIHPHDLLLAEPNEQSYSSGDIKLQKTSDEEHATSTSSGINDDPKTPTPEKETSSKNTPNNENPTGNEEKPQKPDKILPCPRCNSMDTKFCYFNNYNVNQPRHFCKNCQRYWTAGGTMRNTPVGSGRRKNKNTPAASYYHHVIVSEHHPGLKSNGSVLNFGSDVPLCESMNSALNFCDRSQKSEDDHSSSASNSVEKGVNNNRLKNFQGYPLQIPCFQGSPWPYPWNPVQFRPLVPPMVPPTTLGSSGYPVSFYPTSQYWANPWSMPLGTPQTNQFAPTSPLGKHSRDGNLLSPSSRSRTEEFSRDKDSESGVLILKTLRINNPDEAAKSSLWSTLGISKDEHNNNNNNNNNSTNEGNLYKAFQSKGDEKNEVAETSLVNLQANPAALSRSVNFHETS